MSYAIEQRYAAKSGWHNPTEAKRYYGRYSREGITIHWWDLPERAGSHDGTVNYILNKAKQGSGSVNYVLSNDKITVLVDPDNVAWASQNGNPTTISIEFDPRLNAEGYKKAGWLIAELERRYGRNLTLYPHKHWFATQCPGTLDINRMRAEANKWKSGGYNAPAPKPQPKPQPQGGDEMIATTQEADLVYRVLRPNGQASAAEINGTAGKRTYKNFMRDAQAEVANRDKIFREQSIYVQALQNDLGTIKKQLDDAMQRPTKDAFIQVQENLTVCAEGATRQVEHIADLEKQLAESRAKEYNPTELDKVANRVLRGAQKLLPLNKIIEALKGLRK